MADNWIQAVDKEMDKKGTKGAFTKQAKRAGMSVHDFAMEVKNNPSDYSETTRRRGQFALNMEKIADDRKKKKMADGGTTQGYNDKLDEDLGSRLGRESGYSQSLKDRRDESKAGNKTLGRRAYSSVGTMDKDDRMMLMEGGEMEYKHGGKTQGNDDLITIGLIDYKGEYGPDLYYVKKVDSTHIKMSPVKRGEDKLDGDSPSHIADHNDENYFDDVRSWLKGGKSPNGKTYKTEFSKGGETQGYDDRDRESIGERNKGKKSQSLKSRMRESAGMEKSMGRRKYADVSTMDKGDRKMARGGSVEGKIDRDRYVKLRRDKDKAISKLKKEKGVLRKEAKDCDKTGVMPKVSKNENQEVMLLSAIAGIFFGAFLSK
jgi:hypothetical protein